MEKKIICKHKYIYGSGIHGEISQSTMQANYPGIQFVVVLCEKCGDVKKKYLYSSPSKEE